MNWVLRDAKNNNPNIKFMVTLDWGTVTVLQNIFSLKHQTDQQNADNFADNLMAYLKAYGLDGFDMDWEKPAYYALTPDQFAMLLKAIRARFDQETDKHYYLTLSPDATLNLEADAVNSSVDFLNLQLYFDPDLQQEFTDFHVRPELLAYGAKFEADWANDPTGHQSAQDAYAGYVAGGYKVITQWRLNSGNFPFEQENQKELYSLIFPKTE
jgi:GH18 family chitinase